MVDNYSTAQYDVLYEAGDRMNVEEWRTQLKRGVLDYCILLLLNKKTYYGYELINELSKWECISAKESTIYPLLRRLQKEGYLEAEWKESTEGLPPRKYYEISQSGKEYLSVLIQEWGTLVEVINELIKGGQDHE